MCMVDKERQHWLDELGRRNGESEHNWWVVVLLSFFFGYFGVDRFYLGYTWSGILKLVTFGGLGIWYVIDVVLILTGALPDADGRQLKNPLRK